MFGIQKKGQCGCLGVSKQKVKSKRQWVLWGGEQMMQNFVGHCKAWNFTQSERKILWRV